jgi:hypothetical protein
MSATKPPLAPVPPLSAEQLAEAARVEQMVGSWKVQARLFPTETARWLVSHGDYEIEIESARIVEMTPTGKPPVHAVPDEPEQPEPEDPRREALADMLLSAMRQSAPAGMSIERANLDFREMQRESEARMSKLPFPDVLHASGAAGGRKRRHMLLGLALPPASEDGSGIWREIVTSVEWYMRACVNLALKDGVSEQEAMREIYSLTIPVYVWHASGILDPEEDGGPRGTGVDPINLVFRAFAREETEEQRQRRREHNREIIAHRLARDAARRRSAANRQRIFGDPMVTEEQLCKLHVAIGEDAPPSYGIHLNWTSVRLWEQDASQLVGDLPLELLGLAMCGAPGSSAREEILAKALWRLRKLEQRAAFERCLIPLVAMARVWIPDGRLVPIVERAHERFLHRK